MIAWLSLLASAATIEGRVSVRGDGDSIAEATVTSGASQAVTDADGRFVLDIGSATSVDLHVDHPDFLPLDLPGVAPGKPIRIALDAPQAEIEVIVESFAPTSNTSRQHVDAEQALETPGTLDDAVRLVSALPTVAVQREFSPTTGDLVIRGSQPGDTRYLLDGIEIPYLYHYNQYISVFPTSQLESLELYPSTFGAGNGNAVGGIVDATAKKEAPERLHGSINANLLMLGGSVQFPLKNGWWTSLAGRRTYLDFTKTPQYPLWPVWGDFAARAQHDGPGRSFAVSTFGARDAYERVAGELDLLDPVEASESGTFEYRRGFEVISVEQRWLPTPGSHVYGRVIGAVVHDHRSGVLQGGGSERDRFVTLTLRGDVEGVATDHVGWAAGAYVRGERTTITIADSGPEGVLVAQEVPGLARGIDTDATILRLRSDAYAEGRLYWAPVRIFPGVRVQTDTGSTLAVVDPRLAARLKVADQTELEFATGLYSQSPPTEFLVPGADGTDKPDLPLTRAAELSVGVEQTIAGRLELSVEGWGKRTRNIIEQPLAAPIVVHDHGHAEGVDFVTRYRLREHFFLWGSFSLGRSRIATEDGERPAPGDQPIGAGLVMSWNPSKVWNIGLRWRYGSGMPYTPLDGSVYVATDDSWVPIPGPSNSARLPAYTKIDGHLERTFLFRDWSLGIALELGYVPKQASALYPTWSYDYSEQGYTRGPVFLPLVSGRARF